MYGTLGTGVLVLGTTVVLVPIRLCAIYNLQCPFNFLKFISTTAPIYITSTYFKNMK